MLSKTILLPVTCLALIGIICWSCSEDRLDLDPGSLTEASFFQNEVEFERAITGVYAKLTDIYWFNANNPMHGFWQLPGDDVTTIGQSPYEVFVTLNPGSQFIGRYYQQNFQLVNRANTVLEKIAEEEGVYTTPGLKEEHRAQALFFRSWAFFQLWNYYGTAPVITQRIGLADEDIVIFQASSRGVELLDQAIIDLESIVGLLPTEWPDNQRGRVTNNSVHALLAKALISRAAWTNNQNDYQSAIDAIDQITGRSLVTNFADNFDATTENNAESLFEFQASQPATDNVWLPNDFEQGGVGSTSAYWGYYENHFSLFGTPPFIATEKLIAAFDPADPRLPLTANPDDRAFTKYVLGDQKANTGVGSLNNPRLMRYADILLLKAEAIVESSGDLSEAVDLVNAVRTRARGMDSLGLTPANYEFTGESSDEVRAWIQNERLLELAGEGGIRWQDLRRWHQIGHINLASFDFSSDREDFGIEIPKNLVYPIPLGELDINPNATQNPGY
ncbi:MAG: RagB/SusD family nutrient uptake outer membrane protein [Bacteroidota bacterium]